MNRIAFALALGLIAIVPMTAHHNVKPPKGFTALYNGKDLNGWRGGDTVDHRKYLAMPEADRAKQDETWTADMRAHWRADEDELVNDGKGKSSRVSAVYTAKPRASFIAALKDIPEVWEIPYDDKAEPIYPGLVHDYRMGEALAAKGPFPVRRIRLDDYLDDFFFDQSYEHLIGAARNGKNGQVVSLIVGRKIADVDLPGLPHLGSGITWVYSGTPVLATPNLKEGMVTVIDMKTWKTIKHIKTPGPGFFMRSHENTPYAWVDAMMSPAGKDAIQIIDKRTLEPVQTLKPAPGKTAAHVEFTRDGKYALVSIWEMDGALVVYDAATFKEIKRLPMKKPSGKYNVYNKITRSSGTSH